MRLTTAGNHLLNHRHIGGWLMDLEPEVLRSGVHTFLFILIIRSKTQIMSVVKKDVGSGSGHFVICDLQEEYTENLLKALREKFPGDCQFYLFRNIERLKAFAMENPVGILLIGEEYPAGQREEIPAAEKFLLTGERLPDKAAATGSCSLPGENVTEQPVFRYQPADQIVKIILGYQTCVPAEQAGKKKGGVRIRDAPDFMGLIGVYSPVHRAGKTKFAIRLGKQLALKRSVLYLNMEGYSGGRFYFPDGPEYDLGDLIYYVRQEITDPGIRISAMTGQAGGMDYIMPMKNECDLRGVTKEEWMLLFDTIQEKCIYDVVILDLGDCISGLYDILRRCGRVYTHYLEEGAARAKISQYEENLRTAGYGDILSKTVKKKAGRTRNTGERSESAG